MMHGSNVKEFSFGAETGVQTRTRTFPQRPAAGQVAPGGVVAVPVVQEHPLGGDAGQEAENSGSVVVVCCKKWRDVSLLFRGRAPVEPLTTRRAAYDN